MMKKIRILLFFVVTVAFGQTSKLKLLEKHINDLNQPKAKAVIVSIDESQLSINQIARLNYLKAIFYKMDNKDDLAYNQYILAKKQYRQIRENDTVALINLEIVSLLLAIEDSNIDYKLFRNEALEYAKKNNKHNLLSRIYSQDGISINDTNPKLSLRHFKNALKENSWTNELVFRGRIYGNIGATYAHDDIMKLDSALINYNIAQRIYEDSKQNNYLFNILMNKGVLFSKKKEYDKALQYYLKADSIPLTLNKNKNKEILYGYIAEGYYRLGNDKKSLEYIKKQNVYKDILDERKQKIALNEIDARYNTTKTKLENKKLKIKQTILLIGLGLLIIVLTIGVLTYKNLSKKKKIVEQEKLIETQKLETTLKEQELHEIDVMLESQEKERQRIANELHDNLGSMLATLKLNFENLKRQDNGENDNQLFEKTDDLIEEAYQKVRNISHLKNLGVIGSEGLLIAVKKMAEKMSIIEKLQINVIPHGLSERLENTLEVMIFRMIQELCTNVIKHSEATEVNIYMTQHNGSLNIIIEDNGKGFDPKIITEKSGIGLRNIEKKVEQITGTFTIDSILSKGTTIIIDLPI